MMKASLRKPQHDLFAPGPAAHARPQQQAQVFERPHHPCQAPGCAAWGAFGFAGGAWFCAEHRAMGDSQ